MDTEHLYDKLIRLRDRIQEVKDNIEVLSKKVDESALDNLHENRVAMMLETTNLTNLQLEYNKLEKIYIESVTQGKTQPESIELKDKQQKPQSYYNTLIRVLSYEDNAKLMSIVSYAHSIGLVNVFQVERNGVLQILYHSNRPLTVEEGEKLQIEVENKPAG